MWRITIDASIVDAKPVPGIINDPYDWNIVDLRRGAVETPRYLINTSYYISSPFALVLDFVFIFENSITITDAVIASGATLLSDKRSASL